MISGVLHLYYAEESLQATQSIPKHVTTVEGIPQHANTSPNNQWTRLAKSRNRITHELDNIDVIYCIEEIQTSTQYTDCIMRNKSSFIW